MQKSIITTISNIITKNLMSVETEIPIGERVKKQDIITLAKLFENQEISNQGLQKILELLVLEPESDALSIAKRENLMQINDDDFLNQIITQVLANNQAQVTEYKSGKTTILGYLVGQCMKISKGQGNPQKFNQLLITKLT
jgi:aspartyl-tRNA(Asn)/glutamyl-tRNA(Gln) amidotransferase subunit B